MWYYFDLRIDLHPEKSFFETNIFVHCYTVKGKFFWFKEFLDCVFSLQNYPESNYWFSFASLDTLLILFCFSWYSFASLLLLLILFWFSFASLYTLLILFCFSWYSFDSLFSLTIRDFWTFFFLMKVHLKHYGAITNAIQ